MGKPRVIDPTKNVLRELKQSAKSIRRELKLQVKRFDSDRNYDQLKLQGVAARQEQDREANRQLVDSTARTLATTLASDKEGTNQRLTSLEKRQYQGEGSGSGMTKLYGWILAGGGCLLGLAGLGVTIVGMLATLIYFILSHR